METFKSKKIEVLLTLTEKCHTILADFFPHEGLKAVGGSRNFIGTAFFTVLKDCVKEIRIELRGESVDETLAQLDQLWSEAAELIIRIEKVGQYGDEGKINESATLLYFACGTAWNVLCKNYVGIPPHDKKYVRVEPIDILMTVCGRNDKGQRPPDFRILIGTIISEMAACLK